MLHVYIDPDGTQEDAVYVLILHPTGVCYATQCAGHLTYQRRAEGFLIPLGGAKVAQPLIDWFWDTFECHSYIPAEEWGEEKIKQLKELVAQIVIWHCDETDENQKFLELDEERLSECTEAWVPVKTPYGAGILLFPNCD